MIANPYVISYLGEYDSFNPQSRKVFLGIIVIRPQQVVIGMQDYEIKRGHYANIEGEKLGAIIEEVFGNVTKSDNGALESSFGAIAKLTVALKDKKVMVVETAMNSKVDANTAADTIRRYNVFLEKATGLTSKERSKRMQKKAKEGKL